MAISGRSRECKVWPPNYTVVGVTGSDAEDQREDLFVPWVH